MALIAIAVLITAHTWSAQQPLHYVINDEDGLPSNEVYQVVQDDFGYLWIGCDAGLFRYDGNEYTHYSATAQNGRSISGMQRDTQGRLWCKNFNGQIFRVAGDSLRLICDLTGRVSSACPYVLDENCNVFVGLHNRILQFNAEGDSIASFETGDNDTLRIIPILDMACVDARVYFFIPGHGVHCLNPQQKTISQVDTTAASATNSFNVTFFRRGGELHCLRTNNRNQQAALGRITGNVLKYYHLYETRESTFRVHSVCTDHEARLWLCTSDGAYRYDSSVHVFSPAHSIHPGEKISWMLNDRENLHWFATLNNGLLVSPSLDVRVLNPGNSALAEKQITALSLIDGNMFTGTYSGFLYKIDPRTDSVSLIREKNQQKYFTVKKITDAGDYFLVARGIVQFCHKKTGEYFRAPLAHARDLLVTGDSVYFILPEGFARASFREIIEKQERASVTFLRKTGGRSLEYNEADGLLYVAFNDGVLTYRDGKFSAVQHNGRPVFANGLSCSSGITWVAGVTEGVLGLKNGKVEQHYSLENGLNETDVRAIFSVNDTVIACTNEYLYTILTKTGRVGSYNIASGINPKDISGISMFNREVWLATNKGMMHFPFSLPVINTIEPHIAITAVEHAGTALEENIRGELPYENNNLKISFSSAIFRARGKSTFEYRLVGLDSSWTELSWTNRSVTFPGLPPGEYRFEVRAKNESGFRSVGPATFSFGVASPAWQAWWFYLLAAVLAVAVVSGVAILRVRVLRRHAEMKNKMTLSQLTALKAQMNPHFMYNALNSIQDLVLRQDVKNSTLYLGKFSKLMRKVLDASGKEQVTLSDEIEILELYLELEKLRMGDEFEYTIDVSRNVDRETEIPSMIIQPYVENALKHGLLHRKGEKRLAISFALNEQLVCTVTDNGVGREKSGEIRKRLLEKHASFATSATEKRIELLNEYTDKHYSVIIIDLNDNGSAAGTKVIIHIPVSES